MSRHDPFISIRDVSKSFGQVRAVDHVSFDIGAGEFFSLLGPSGCGKTTLLRLLAGFESPTSGEIFIDGQPMSTVPPHHRPVNMVFQNYAIFPHLNVGANIAYGLRKAKLSRAEKNALVDEMLELIKLPGYGKRWSHELSGGERQRVALARALIKRPKVLLLDEPLGALDKQLRERMQLELRALQRSVGITFVFVTHDQEEALTMSDRIAVMSKGRDLQVDTPTLLYEAPKSREVAAFIGNMNFFDARVTAVDRGSATVDAGVLGINGQDLDAALFGLGHDQLAGHDQALLVGQRDGLAGFYGGYGGSQRRGSGSRDHHHVGFRHGRDLAKSLLPGHHFRCVVFQQGAQALGAVIVAHRGEARVEGFYLPGQPLIVTARGQPHDLEAVLRGLDHPERALADGAGGSKDRDALWPLGQGRRFRLDRA